MDCTGAVSTLAVLPLRQRTSQPRAAHLHGGELSRGQALGNRIWNNEDETGAGADLPSWTCYYSLHLLAGTVGAVMEAVTKNPDPDVSAKSHN